MKRNSTKLPSRQELIDERKQVFHGMNRHRLSPGEYYLPSGDRADITVHAARERLLLAIIEREPKVLKSLEREVLPHYWA